MAKKKHKSAKKPQTHGVQSGETYKLVRKEKSGDFDIDWTLFAARPDEETLSDFITLPLSMSYPLIKKMYLTPLNTDAGTQNYIEKTAKLKSKLESQFNIWLSSCTDAHPALNKYNTDAVNAAVADTLDFRDYTRPDNPDHKDLCQQGFLKLQDNPDIAMLWSTSEIVEIRITDNLKYRVHRVLFDHLNNAVRYCIYEYIKLRISDTEVIEIPSQQIVVTVDIGRITDKTTMYAYHGPYDITAYRKYPYQNALFNMQANTAENPDDFTGIRIGIMGANCLINTETHLELHHSHMGKAEYRNIRNRIREFCGDMYGIYLDKQRQLSRQLNAISLVISAIIITNSYLKSGKLSKPVRTVCNTEHETEVVLQNQPERKTRVLGRNIKITSNKRPQSPDIERIIRYHTPEWTRKSHLRHLKSGKVIEIPAGKCRRKCVDMTNVKSNTSEQAVDYVIKPERS